MKFKKNFINKLPQIFLLVAILNGNVITPMYAIANDVLAPQTESVTTLDSDSAGEITSVAAITGLEETGSIILAEEEGKIAINYVSYTRDDGIERAWATGTSKTNPTTTMSIRFKVESTKELEFVKVLWTNQYNSPTSYADLKKALENNPDLTDTVVLTKGTDGYYRTTSPAGIEGRYLAGIVAKDKDGKVHSWAGYEMFFVKPAPVVEDKLTINNVYYKRDDGSEKAWATGTSKTNPTTTMNIRFRVIADNEVNSVRVLWTNEFKGPVSATDLRKALEANPGLGEDVKGTIDSKGYYNTTPPSKPILISPIGGIVINNDKPLMQWEDSTPATGRTIKLYNYEFHYECTETTVESCGKIWKETRTTSEYQAGPTADGRGFWRVQAVDDLDNTSEWSDFEEFIVDTKAPTTPKLISPINGAYVHGASVTNVWEEISDASSYEYESYHDEGLTNRRWEETYTSNSKTATDVEDATFWWRVRAVDKAGNKSDWSEAWKLTVDSTRPTAEIIAVDFSKGDTEIKGKASDNEGIKGHWFEITDPNGKVFYITKDLNNSAKEVAFDLSEAKDNDNKNITLVDGQYKIRYVVTDLAGNRSDDPKYSNPTIHYIVIDSIRPIMEVITPTEGQVLRNDAIKVNVKITDNQGLTKLVINLYKDGSLFKSFSKPLNGETEFSYEHDLTGLNLEDGKYYVKANALDKAGTISNTVTRNFVIDNTKPIVKINLDRKSYIESGDTVAKKQVPEVEARDENLDYFKVLNDKGVQVGSNSYAEGRTYRFGKIQHLAEGRYTVIAVDKAGNESDPFIVYVDNTAPIMEVITPTEGQVLRNDAIKVNVKITDNQGLTKLVINLYKDGSLFKSFSKPLNGETEFSYEHDLTGLNLEDGKYYVKANALDKAGTISNTVTRNFVIDNTKPIVKINLDRKSYIESGDYTSAIQEPEIEASDANLLEFGIFKDGKRIAGPTDLDVTERRANIAWLGEGKYIVIAKDRAGNESDPFEVNIDNTAPTVSNIVIDKEYVKAGDKITITAEVTDTGSGVKAVSADFSYNSEYTDRPASPYKSVSMKSVGENKYQLTYTVPTEWKEGLLYITVAARDKVENYIANRDLAKTITIDNTAPITQITSPIDNAYVNGTIDFKGTVTDANLLRYYYEIKGVTSETVTQDANLNDETIYTWDTTKNSDGEYEMRLEARDKADNKDSQSIDVIKVHVDNTAPVIEITSPLNGSTRKTGDGKLEIFGSISDNIKANYIHIQIVDAGGHSRGIYTVHGAKTNELLTTLDISALEDGTYSINYWGADHIGNVSETKSITITIDNTPEPTPQTPEPVPTPPSTEETGEVAGATTTNTKTSTTNRTGKNTIILQTNAIETIEEEEEEEEISEAKVLGEEQEKTCEANKKISGNIYIDKNNNDELDEGEKGIKDIKVQIYVMEDGEKKIIQELTTDEDGYFETTGVCTGKYNIQVEEETLPKGHELKGEATREIVVTDTDTEENKGAYLGVSVEDNRSFIQKYWYWLLLIIPVIGYIIFKKKNEEK